MSSPPYMPLYVADYLSDTTHLSTVEHGAYLLLLMTLWRSGGTMSSDDRHLAKCARLSNVQWGRIRASILPLFNVQDGQLTHGRLTRELEKSTYVIGRKRLAGSLGGKANALKYNVQRPAGAKAELNYSEPYIDNKLSIGRFADEGVRAVAVAERGEAWVRSWLDPASWDAETRTVAARSRLAYDTLSRGLGTVLRGQNVALGCMGSGEGLNPACDVPEPITGR